jgi:3-hydroxyisobutyrate dehydrogenase-like beta-hydroxyacid dehydrogenase
MNANGFDARYLGPRPGSASSVKMVRSVLMKGLEALGVEALVTADRQGIREEVLDCLADVDLVDFRDHLASLVQTHVVHARRRWEEMGLVAQTLRESGVEPRMTEVTEQILRRSVEAGIAPADGKVPSLDDALKLLSDRVVRGG